MTKMKSRWLFALLILFIVDMRSDVNNFYPGGFRCRQGQPSRALRSDTGRNMPHRKGDAEEFPLLAQNARNTKRLCRPTSPGDLPQFRTRFRDYGNHTITPAVWRIVHGPSIMQHQAQPRFYSCCSCLPLAGSSSSGHAIQLTPGMSATVFEAWAYVAGKMHRIDWQRNPIDWIATNCLLSGQAYGCSSASQTRRRASRTWSQYAHLPG
jgi:hypothetical protein